MTRAIPNLDAVSRAIVTREAAEVQAPAELAAALETAMMRLCTAASDLVGTAGFIALLRRAIHVAVPASPWLADLEVQPDPHGRPIGGLAPYAAREGRDAVVAGVSALLAAIFELLCQFIGAGLTIQLIARLWPGALRGHAPDAPEENPR